MVTSVDSWLLFGLLQSPSDEKCFIMIFSFIFFSFNSSRRISGGPSQATDGLSLLSKCLLRKRPTEVMIFVLIHDVLIGLSRH